MKTVLTMIITRLTVSLLLLLVVVSSFAVTNATRIGQTHHHRQMQKDELEEEATIITDNIIPAACEGWKENKIQECIAEQERIGSVLSQYNLDSIPAECAWWGSDRLGECLSQRQTILDNNGVTSVPSGCEGLQVDELDFCIADYILVQTVLNQHNLDSIPAECAWWGSDKLGECLMQRQTILDHNGVTSVPSGCEGLQVDELEFCITDYIRVQTVLSQYNLDSIPAECAWWGSDRLGECLSERQSILDQNGVTTIPSICEGLGIDELDACLVDYNLVQTILTANNLEEVPADCTGVNSDKLTECLHQWRLTQIILGASNERIPSECAGMKNEKNLEKCLEEFTLAPTNNPTYAPTLPPVTDAPTIRTTDIPTSAPIAWKAFAAEIGFETASEEEKEAFNVLETEQVAVPIGRFAMSVTRYVNKKVDWNNDRRRALKGKNDGKHPRQHELDATREHLREVYEAEFQIPVARIDLHFADTGDTAIGLRVDGTVGDGMMRHSVFFGNALFVEGEANATAYLVPTEEQLEKATNDAFTGEQKQAFIEKYHYEVTGRNYFGIKYSYDVNVRKSIQPDVELSTVESSAEPDVELSTVESSAEGAGIAVADQEGGKSWVNRIQEWSSSVESSFGTTLIVLILSAGVLLGTLIGLIAIVIRRKRRNRVENRVEKSQSRVIMGDSIDDEPDALGSVIDSEIENDNGILHAQYALQSKRIQSSLPIITDNFEVEDSVSQLATSDDDSIYKGMKGTKEVEYALQSNRIQSSLHIMTDNFEDSVSQLATSDDGSIYKGVKETKEVDSEESTIQVVDSGDSGSAWSFSLRSTGSGNGGKEASDEDEMNVEHQLP